MLLLGLLVQAAHADLFVIVNNQNSTAALSAVQIERIFLLKAKRFESGEPAAPVNQDEKSAVRSAFNEKVMGRDEAQLKYYWSRKMFSGGDKPPPVLRSDAEVVSFVAENAGGIGYLATAPKDERVKVVLHVKN